MKTVAILQARLRSTRLPAKVLLDMGGRTVLERCLERLARIEGVDEVICATGDSGENDLIAEVASRAGFRVARGSESNVLLRYASAAHAAAADVVMRFTADCPLIDPEVSATVLRAFLEEQRRAPDLDYASNTQVRRLPRGLDTEVMSMRALERANADATDRYDREHVTPFLYRQRSLFHCIDVFAETESDLSIHRWTLDTLEDYRFLWTVYSLLGPRATAARMQDILTLVEQHPELVAINSSVQQKPAAWQT